MGSLIFNKLVNMATRAQALLAARRRADMERATAREEYLASLGAGEVPMASVLNNGLLSDSEQQNLWNTMAANQWQNRDRTSGLGMFMGTPNQMNMSLEQLTRTEQWQTMDDKTRLKLLQRMYGTEVASRYASALEDREAVASQRRKTFDDAYETERTIAREKRQSQARLAATEPEMLHRKLMSGDWVVRGNGMFERNPLHNPNNPMSQEAPYIPLSPSGEATVARHWGAVMPGRPNPLSPEKLARIQVAEENPNMSADDIVKTAQARLASMAAARENPARAIADADEARALQAIAARRASMPTAPGAPMYDLERTSPAPVAAAPNGTSGNAEPLRFGQKVYGMLENMGEDIARVPAVLDTRLMNIGSTLERIPGYIGGFMDDLRGIPRTPMPPAPAPMRTSESIYYPDWLK